MEDYKELKRVILSWMEEDEEDEMKKSKTNEKSKYWVAVHVVHERGYYVEAKNEEAAKLKVMNMDDEYDVMLHETFEYERMINKKIAYTCIDDKK